MNSRVAICYHTHALGKPVLWFEIRYASWEGGGRQAVWMGYWIRLTILGGDCSVLQNYLCSVQVYSCKNVFMSLVFLTCRAEDGYMVRVGFVFLCLSLFICNFTVYILRNCTWYVSDGSIASRVKRKGSPCERNSVLDESIASRAKRKGSPWQKDFSLQGASWYETKGLPCEQGFVADGSVVSLADRKSSSCQQCGSSQSCEVYVYSGPSLPEVTVIKSYFLLQSVICFWLFRYLDEILGPPIRTCLLVATLTCFYFLPWCCRTKHHSMHLGWQNTYRTIFDDCYMHNWSVSIFYLC
jgi:hypothetical protein